MTVEDTVTEHSKNQQLLKLKRQISSTEKREHGLRPRDRPDGLRNHVKRNDKPVVRIRKGPTVSRH